MWFNDGRVHASKSKARHIRHNKILSNICVHSIFNQKKKILRFMVENHAIDLQRIDLPDFVWND